MTSTTAPGPAAPAAGPPSGPPRPPRVDHPRGLLVASCLGVFMCFLEVTAAISTLRAIQVALGVPAADLSWISSGYTLVVAAVVLSGSALGERFGRRRVFLTGVALLATGSVVVATASGFPQIVTGRVISGFGGALALPTSLAFIATSFPEPARRNRGIALWASMSGAGLAVGPLLGGALLEGIGWQAVYCVNAPLAVLTFAVTLWAVPETKVPGRKLDLPGQVLVVVGLAALISGITVGGREGYGDPFVLTLIGLGVVCLAVLVPVELRQRTPMLDLRMMGNRAYATALVVAAVGLFSFVGTIYLEVLFLQRVRGETPLVTGLQLLSGMLPFLVVTVSSAALAARFGAARLLVAGGLLTGVAAVVLFQQEPGTAFWVTGVGLALAGFGSGLVVAPSTAATMAVVAPPQAPAASGAVSAFRQVGSVLATAVLGAVLATRFASGLPAQLAESGITGPAARAVVAAAANGGGSGPTPAPIQAAVDAAFTNAVHTGLLVVAVASVAAALLAAAGLPVRRRAA